LRKRSLLLDVEEGIVEVLDVEEGIVEVLDVEQSRSGAKMVLDVEEALLWRCRLAGDEMGEERCVCESEKGRRVILTFNKI